MAGIGQPPARRSPARLPPWLKRAFAAPNALYAHGLGRLLGHRFVQIEHVGRRSGRTYHSVVEVLRYDRSTGETTVIAGYGPTADWLRNIQAAGAAALDFGRGPRPAAYRLLPADEAIETWRTYCRRNRFIRPALLAVITALVGWRFDGSEAAVRRMVDELPMVAFTPAAG